MAEAMKGVTKAMTRMNKNMKLPQMQKTMQGLIASFLFHKIDSTKVLWTEHNLYYINKW